MRTNLNRPITLMRGMTTRGLAESSGAVDREGGSYGAGLIRGAAVITRGEALGHGLWIDVEFLSQVNKAIRQAGKTGVKARFTHPGLSSDGLGSFLGRFKNPSMDGDIVRADLHFAASAHDTPDGDLADYLMNLADEDPAAFGNSIVFRHDWQAEEEVENANQTEVEEQDGSGRPVKRLRFRSPDPLNENNYPHARLKQLRTIDAVDSPAANPSGMFHATDVAHEADSLLSYACGLTDERPELSMFDIEPDRIQGFVSKFLDRNGLTLKPKEAPVPKTNTDSAISPEMNDNPTANPTANPPADPPADPRAEFAAQHKAYVAEFGAANGSQWLAEGKSIDECRTLHAAELEKQRQAELAAKDAEIAKLAAERDELKTRIDQAKLGEEEHVEFSPPEGSVSVDKKLSQSLPPGVARFVSAQRAAASN